ncbi:DJ-1/PfpI family protein [Synechocystis salina]|jgi:cyclohexyl-isocyanide hydratase|uniref:DJ-1/PfpI family protein n=1 Tax=Synechocystis salina LEGE 00031 TaxID=1828736 RepID=A0ABR9VR61_9SYNC|nr:DJ-1/PfpI family protein [Synechocystis salina]MBE9242893.1 DJ-1/PfpI family protein [Synechocystis salina LEGE 00041]MBE9253837.1 DJ-1/PfpI family protein [Synechocystis salina LEGE 00031]
MTQIQIGFLIYPGVVQLDVMGAHQVLAFPPQTTVHLVGKTFGPVISNEGVILTSTTTMADCPPLDVICVPGGGLGQVEVMKDSESLDFLKQQSITAQYVASVCTGSLILAVAGLLKGYKATCHWAFRDQLARLGVEVVPQRVVIDRNRVTGAGVTSGIDFGLTLLSLLCGEPVARTVQLMLEYDPEPPFDAGRPETAGSTVVNSLLQAGKPLMDAFWAQTQATAAQL